MIATVAGLDYGRDNMVRLKIREVALSKGISQRQLALRSGIDLKNVQKILRHPTANVTTYTLDRLAKVLDVDVSELVESVPDE